MSKFGEYISETTSELVTKVSWPTWAELQESAIIVMSSSAIIGLLVFGMDFSFEYLMEKFYELFY